MSRFLVVTEGVEPASAEPVFATGSPTLVAAAIAAMFGQLNGVISPDSVGGAVVGVVDRDPHARQNNRGESK